MIIIILTIAFVLRLININQSLWLDEGINVIFARALSYKDLIFSYSVGDFHPPFYHLILKTAIEIFGSSELIVRLPSILFGVATVYVTYLIARKLYDEKTGYIASTLMATAPLHIYYSQEARMYSLAAFFTSLSVFYFISIIKKDRLVYWIGFILSTALMLYCDYLPYLMLPIYFLFLAYSKKI